MHRVEGGSNQPLTAHDRSVLEGQRLGVSVMGVSNLQELQETMRVWRSILAALRGDSVQVFRPAIASSSNTSSIPPKLKSDRSFGHEFGAAFGDVPDEAWGVGRKAKVQAMVSGVRNVLGEWYDFAWDSPGAGFVNKGNPTPTWRKETENVL